MTRIQRSEHLPVEAIFPPRRKYSGEIGLEIEVEGRGLPQQEHLDEYWTVKRDGSLRGESAEYVLSQPVARRTLPDALNYLDRKMTELGTVPDMSYRTSVHVHVNQQGVRFRDLITEMVLYYIFEESLVGYCGPERVGNKFCLRARDAENIIQRLHDAVSQNNFGAIMDENIKYAAMNINALGRFNSLEFRAMRGTLDHTTILTWVRTLMCLKDAAISGRFASPVDVISSLSAMGTKEFTQSIFGPMSDIVFADKDFHDHMYYGTRLVQELAYCVNWNHDPAQFESKSKKPKKNAQLIDPDEGLQERIRQMQEEANINRIRFGAAPAAPIRPIEWGGAQWQVQPEPVVEVRVEDIHDDDFNPEPEDEDL